MTDFYVIPADRLTPRRRENLTRLAAYLQSLPKSYKEFDMGTYVNAPYQIFDHDKLVHYAEYNGSVSSCGTSACAVGHGPSAGIFVPDNIINHMRDAAALNSIYWYSYAEQCFTGNDDMDFLYDPLWTFLFSEDWVDIQNHHWEAAARIRYVLDTNNVPMDQSEDTIRYQTCEMKSDTAKEYHINKRVELPDDFYTPEMLERFEKGKRLLEKL